MKEEVPAIAKHEGKIIYTDIDKIVSHIYVVNVVIDSYLVRFTSLEEYELAFDAIVCIFFLNLLGSLSY